MFTMLAVINITAWALVLGFPLYGMRRGAMQMVCIGAYILFFSVLIVLLAPGFAEAVPLVHGSRACNTGWWQLLLFIPLLGLAFPLGIFTNRFLAHTFEPFEEILGLLAGLVVAFIAVHAYLGAIILCSVTDPQLHAFVNHLFLVREVVSLDSFHGAQQWLLNLNKATEL